MATGNLQLARPLSAISCGAGGNGNTLCDCLRPSIHKPRSQMVRNPASQAWDQRACRSSVAGSIRVLKSNNSKGKIPKKIGPKFSSLGRDRAGPPILGLPTPRIFVCDGVREARQGRHEEGIAAGVRLPTAAGLTMCGSELRSAWLLATGLECGAAPLAQWPDGLRCRRGEGLTNHDSQTSICRAASSVEAALRLRARASGSDARGQ